MKNNYFKDCTTNEQVKKTYRKLASKLHPDCKGGNEKEFIDYYAEEDIRQIGILVVEQGTRLSRITDIAEELYVVCPMCGQHTTELHGQCNICGGWY
jgi:hypothetical protein